MRLGDPYVVAGDRAYLVGAQDGGFPDRGWHVEGEMGGLWCHPVKLLDGFWLRVGGQWLAGARRFVTYPAYCEHHFSLPAAGLTAVRRQFCPEGLPGLVVQLTLRDERGERRRLPVDLLVRSDLRPAWLGERVGMVDGPDQASYGHQAGAWVVRDALGGWTLLVGGEGPPARMAQGDALGGPQRTAGRGTSVLLGYDAVIPALGEATLTFYMAASPDALARMRSDRSLLGRKERLYEGLLRFSRVSIPDSDLAECLDWVKVNYRWLLRKVDGLGSGLGAGLDDYPWFFSCDAGYALLGALAVGQFETAERTLDLLARVSQRHSRKGRIVHEVSSCGAVYHAGNTQETPQYVRTVHATWRWTGNAAFLRRHYALCRRGLLDWTLGEMDPDGSLLPGGTGISETPGMHGRLIDVAVHTAEALACLAEMADAVGDAATAERCAPLAAAARRKVEEAFWRPVEGLYSDMLGEQRRHWVLLSPLEAGFAPPDRAEAVLRRMETPEFSNEWGLYVIASRPGEVMSISTGLLAVCALNYGRLAQGLACMRRLASTLKLRTPGAISEFSPDGGCFVQAWSGYGIAWPLITQIFGVRPDAPRRHLHLKPQLPEDWEDATLDHLRVGDNRFRIRLVRRAGRVEAEVRSRKPGWSVEVM